VLVDTGKETVAAARFQLLQVKLLYALIQKKDSGYFFIPVEAPVEFDKGCFSVLCKASVFVDTDKRQRLLLCSK
jgi:hypothetical protein